MDPEIQPLTNKVNKIEQKLEEQEQRIELLEHEEEAIEQKIAMEQIVNPAETILIDSGENEPLENKKTTETEILEVIEHTPESFSQKWFHRQNLERGLIAILSIAFLGPFIFGLHPESLLTPILILILDLGLAILTITTKQPRLPIIALIGTMVVYLNWFFASEPGVVNPDLLTSFYFVAGYFAVLSAIPLIRIFGQKKKISIDDLWLLVANSFLLYTAIFFLFRDTFMGASSFFAIVLLLGNGAVIGYYFYNKHPQLKISSEPDREEMPEQ